MLRFCQAVLASAARWENPRAPEARDLCLGAADVEAGLAIWEQAADRADLAHQHFFKAALLYDLAGMPGTAATLARRNGLAIELQDFFARESMSVWGTLAASDADIAGRLERASADPPTEVSRLFEVAVAEIVAEHGRVFQTGRSATDSGTKALRELGSIAGSFKVEFGSDDVDALVRSIALRRENATLALLRRHSKVSPTTSRKINLPLELWPVQRQAIETGLLSSEALSYGLAAPTGTGKTSLTRALIASTLAEHPGKKVIYVCPSRALVHQVAYDLAFSLQSASIVVRELGAHLTVHEQLQGPNDDANVLVFTPERADLLMRVDPEFIQAIGLVIVDEAHHIEQEARGILLEFYLWRLRRLIPATARIVQLSAVTPNIAELVDWLASKSQSTAVKVDWRTNRLRLGVFERARDGSGIVQFEGLAPFVVLERENLPNERISRLAALADRLARTGIVLVLSTSVDGAEKVAEEIARIRGKPQSREQTDELLERLDAKIERELYPDASLRRLIKGRIAYHHAQLPPSVRATLEAAISRRHIDVVCATTTLAEGVNFPFSTVLVESLVGKDFEITPRSLWNIAGRAGRFGVDSEGHCIIFEPSHFEARLTRFRLSDYLRTKLDDIPPVRSALAVALTDLSAAVRDDKIAEGVLASVDLSGIAIDGKPKSQRSKRLRSLVNLVRVGYTHAHTSEIINLDDKEAHELSSEMFASRQLDEPTREFASAFGIQQRRVVGRAFDGRPELMEIAARIGWSLETQSILHEWLISLPDWGLIGFGRVTVAGRILQPDRLGYLLGPVSKHMGEFGGDKLEGFTAFVSQGWIMGLPLTSIRENQKEKNFGRLVRIIYSRVQYLLPWALFGVNELLQFEARRRQIRVQEGVKDLSVLAAEGVPNFNALHLVLTCGMERVDATRVAVAYQTRSASGVTDVLGFFRGLGWSELVGIVRGPDRRRLDPDLRSMWERVRETSDRA